MPHIYALNKESILVSAPEALVGLDYYCPLCNAVLHVRQCVTRIPHYFLYNDYHKSSDCHDLEKVRAVIRDPTLINAQKFANSIMSQKVRIGVPGHGGHQKSYPPNPRSMLPPNSIRQLVVCGARFKNPSDPIDGGIFSDVYVGPKAYGRCIKKGCNLNFRVVELWLDSALDHRIRYVAKWTYHNQLFCAFFEHHVDDSLDFEAIADALFQERHYYYGRTLWLKRKFKFVAVGGEWSVTNHQYCHNLCNYCNPETNATSEGRHCLGMWIAQLKNLDQIYYADLPGNRF